METFLAGVIIGAVLQRVVLKEQHNVELFNQEEWYLAHDIFEEIWHTTIGLERITIQAILQIAVAEVHLGNGNIAGAKILYGEGFGRLSDKNLPDLGIDISQFSIDVEKRFRILQILVHLTNF